MFSTLIRIFKHPAGGRGRTQKTLRWQVSRDVHATESESGLVLLHARSGFVYTTNLLGLEIWRLLKNNQPAESIAAQLSQQCEVSIGRVEADANRFLHELHRFGLIVATAQ